LAQQTLPAMDFVDLSGRPIPLNDYTGHLLYLDFWASWCGPCRQSFPWMNDMQATYGKQGLRILAINLDKNKSNAERFLREVPANFQIAWDPDGNSARAHQVKTMPTSLLIACKGGTVTRHSGFSASMKAALEADIKSGLCRA
jgi:cytochrome c biogenesis protein CcmG/thiol:disulfide interchange protein DsbE